MSATPAPASPASCLIQNYNRQDVAFVRGDGCYLEDAQGRSKATATTLSPGRAGEATTMVNGMPNANPDAPTLTKSKSERKMEREMKKAERKQARDLAVMGQVGAQVGSEPGTPYVSPAGNPSVFKGGTPK